jgi:hypothetical protein
LSQSRAQTQTEIDREKNKEKERKRECVHERVADLRRWEASWIFFASGMTHMYTCAPQPQIFIPRKRKKC